MKRLISIVLFSLVSLCVEADDFAATRAKLEAAVSSNVRTKAEKQRDENRKPIETMEFLGLRDNMKVVDVIPGRGWYTKILVPVLHEKGQYIASINANRIKDRILSLPGFERGRVVQEDARYWRENGDPFLTASIKTLNIENADMAISFLNYPNFDATSRKEINEQIYIALKPGGIYGVISHTARHMEPAAPHNTRRFDPVEAIKEITEAGFEFVNFSNVHYHPQDDLTKKTTDKQVAGSTDRWTLKFQKPLENLPPPAQTSPKQQQKAAKN